MQPDGRITRPPLLGVHHCYQEPHAYSFASMVDDVIFFPRFVLQSIAAAHGKHSVGYNCNFDTALARFKPQVYAHLQSELSLCLNQLLKIMFQMMQLFSSTGAF